MDAESHDLLLGIDIGTTDAKCTFYSSEGLPVVARSREYGMLHPKPGWAEEDPQLWWRAVVDNIQDCIEQRRIDPSRVAAIGVSCTNSIIPVDRDGRALHNAILQLDQRASDEVEWIGRHIGEERLYRITGNRLARGTFSLPTLRWLVEHRAEVVEKTYKFLVPSGYIIAKLTGNFTINQSRMGFTLLGDIRTGDWDMDLVRDAGLDAAKLPRPCRASEVAGCVSAESARLTGLTMGTPVVAGAMDTVAAAVGAGASHDGDIFLAIGTCGRLCHTSTRPVFDRRLMNCRNAYEGTWLNIEATNAAGASLRWFRDLFGGCASAMVEDAGISCYEAFDRLAEATEPGAGGLVYLPYLSGERCPLWDPNARGVFFGAAFSTRYGDFVRAIMEGVAFSLRQGMEIVLAEGDRPDYITLGGGVANSRIWCRIFADVLGYPIVKLRINETETLGDALLAGSGVGLIDDPTALAKHLANQGEVFRPDPAAGRVYDDYFDVFKDIYSSLKGDFLALNDVSGK